MTSPEQSPRASTGIEGLDAVLGGGLPPRELYLVEGTPGTGKTLLSAHFLQAGVEAGERCLLVSLSQDAASIKDNAQSIGLSMEGVEIHDVTETEASGTLGEEQVIFHAENVELGETVRELTEAVERANPDRVVFDGIAYLRLLTRSLAHYRRQLLSLRNFFSKRDITVLFTDDETVAPDSGELPSLAYGVIRLTQQLSAYGNEQRHLRILKLRGSSYEAGSHDLRITHEGVSVFPRLKTEEIPSSERSETLTSGIDALDDLLGGGLQAGTSCLIVGPSGTGKTSIATLYADAAAQRGDASAIFLFDELESTFTTRSETLGMPVTEHCENDLLRVHPVATGELSPVEFAHFVRHEVEERDVRVVIIDTLTGYLSAMPDERFLVTQMHDLLAYLSKRGVLTILVVAQHGVVGEKVGGPVEVSYLADAVMLTRHFGRGGAMHQAVSVFKKRYGGHERRVRELFIEEGGLRVGDPMNDPGSVMTGRPPTVGEPASESE